MRVLQTKDIFTFGRLIKRLDMADELRKIAKDANSISDIWNGGFDLVYMIFERAVDEEAEELIYRAFSGPFEMTPDQLAELPVKELINLFKQLAEENDLKSFFGNAAALTPPQS